LKSITHAGAVVYRGSREKRQYLIITSARGNGWVLPKGRVEDGETLIEAATREVREESGVVGRIVGQLGVVRRRRGKVRAKFFLMRRLHESESREARRVRWLEVEDALERLSRADARALLDKAHRLLNGR
jgi:ADP-ribose pyrophosphatase YjhB (NUDIX family)